MTERLSRRNLYPKLIGNVGLALFCIGTPVIGIKAEISGESASRIPRPSDEDVKRSTDIMDKFNANNNAAILRAVDSQVDQVRIPIPQEVRDAKKVLDLNRPYVDKIQHQNSDAFSGLDGQVAGISVVFGLGLIAIANKLTSQTHIKQ